MRNTQGLDLQIIIIILQGHITYNYNISLIKKYLTLYSY
jgi:hypothetical protein